jgi:hypothetical protein
LRLRKYEYNRCPYCDEEVLASAIKCKHCKSLLENESYDQVLEPEALTVLSNEEMKTQKYTQEILDNTDFANANQVRPWVRYFARMTDAFMFGIIFIILLSYIYPPFIIFLLEYEIISTAILLFFWIFIEAFLLSWAGTTPGKYLLSTYVKDVRGDNLNYADALSRSFQVFMRGLGFGIFPINIITMIIAYRTLTRDQFGITTWDCQGMIRVRHQPLKPTRITLLVIVWVIIIIINIL